MNVADFIIAFLKAISGKETSAEFELENLSISLGNQKKTIASVNGKIRVKIIKLKEIPAEKKKLDNK